MLHSIIPKVHTLVMSELPVGHITMILYNLPHMLRRHVFLLGINKTKLPLFSISLVLQLLPPSKNASCKLQISFKLQASNQHNGVVDMIDPDSISNIYTQDAVW